VADVRAVGPGVWNGWKGELLRTLYYETEPLLSSGHTIAPQSERIEQAQAALSATLAEEGWADEAIARLLERHYPAYWLRTELATQLTHARLLHDAEERGEVVASHFSSDTFTELTELTILAPNHANLLALMAGACSAAGADIMGANIYTTRDGMALDSFLIRRSFSDTRDEARRIARITKTIRQLLSGEVYLDQLLAKKRAAKRKSAFYVPPDLTIDNEVSNRFTILEARGLDRPGLLYELTSAISELNLDINSAHIATYGEKVVDVFYVTDLTGNKITSKSRQRAIKRRLEAVLGGGRGQDEAARAQGAGERSRAEARAG
jgi:[protein-PII] uridylyltransferase